MVAVMAGALGLAGTAQAIPSGFGWSASWNYYLANAFQVDVALPGASVIAYSTDDAGIRLMNGSVVDVDGRDRYCARVRVFSTDDDILLATKTACGGANVPFYTPTYDGAVFVHLDLMQGNTIVKSTFTFVPSSSDDATLRTVGTRTSWAYVNAGQYHLEVHRPGVDLVADGTHQVANQRSVLASLVDSGVDGSCAAGWATDGGATSASGATCDITTAALFDSLTFSGYITLKACYFPPPAATARCLSMHFPEPY